MTDAYADAATYRAVVDKSDTGADAAILTDLTAISRYIDAKLGRFFTKDAVAVARVYPAEDVWRTLYVDDLVSVTSIKIDDNASGIFTDDTALGPLDYELLPRNAPSGPEPRPYTAIEMTFYGTRYSFPGNTRVQVTGIWGWPAVPAAIARACCHLTGILRLETPRAQATVSEIGQVVQASWQARNIIESLITEYGKKVLI